MEYTLDDIETRILGVLIEKQMTTPEYYPLTLNALVNGCNQKSNRKPIMELNGADTEGGLQKLREKKLIWQVKTQGSRSLKFEHNMKEVFNFSSTELAIVCELLLRGAQTVGELKNRANRMATFESLGTVEYTLKKLTNHEKGPIVEKKPRIPGQKENRYAQLFCNTDDENEPITSIQQSTADEKEPVDKDRIAQLEETVERLSSELEALKTQFEHFKQQFE